ncbi:MAG: hypothetical protein ACI4A8_11260 [Muribaculaceae bacterium]
MKLSINKGERTGLALAAAIVVVAALGFAAINRCNQPVGAPSEFTEGGTAPMSIDSARMIIDSIAGKTEHKTSRNKKAKGLPHDRQTGPELPVIEE